MKHCPEGKMPRFGFIPFAIFCSIGKGFGKASKPSAMQSAGGGLDACFEAPLVYARKCRPRASAARMAEYTSSGVITKGML